MAKSLMKAWFGLVPVLVLAAGCGFFSVEDAPGNDSDDDDGSGGTGTGGATGGSAGTAVTGGPGGTGGGSASGGTGGQGGAGGRGGGSGSGAAGTGGGAGTGGSSGSGGAGGSAGTETSGGAGAGGTSAGSAGTQGDSGSAGSAGSAAGGCASLHPAAVASQGHCYYANSTGVNWGAARDACEALGAHLVTISSDSQAQFDAENTFVWGLVNNMEVWIGATDGKMDSEAGDMTPFTWITGEAMTIDNWADGEPNNYQKDCPGGGTCFEHCGFIQADLGGQWNDDICGNTKPYVCEWDMGG